MIKEDGIWTIGVYPDTDRPENLNVYINSDDFTHDVMLCVNGDFESLEQKKAYAEEIAKRLNYYNLEIVESLALNALRSDLTFTVKWPETEDRIDIIGSNGGTGLHYGEST